MTHPDVLDAAQACLVVIDVQERFRTVQKNFDSMLDGAVRLVRAFRALELPVLVTEQYPEGLGTTVKELEEVLGAQGVHDKTSFSSCGSEEFSRRLGELGRKQILVCGIETHVCVSQTVHDLLQQGFSVHVAVDAVESRKALDREMALRRMENAGAILTTAETACFELLRDAKHPKFKEVQGLFK